MANNNKNSNKSGEGRKWLPFNPKNHYRLILLNSTTFEEAFNWNLKPINVFIITGIAAICLIILTAILMAFTPLREYIPGYKDPRLDRQVYELTLKVDSLHSAMEQKERYLYIIQSLYNGDNIELVQHTTTIDSVDYTKITDRRTTQDSLFRLQVENEDRTFAESNVKRYISEYNNLFMQPVKGAVLVDKFIDGDEQHGIEFIVNKDTPILSIADGTIIYSGWNADGGNTIVVMHRNNFTSIYKNLDVATKKVGDYVKVGDVIAIIGGRQGVGNKLNFELWRNGAPINPSDYMIIE